MSLLSRARSRVQELGGGGGDSPSVEDAAETCWRCGVWFFDIDAGSLSDAQGLCAECVESVGPDEAESRLWYHGRGL